MEPNPLLHKVHGVPEGQAYVGHLPHHTYHSPAREGRGPTEGKGHTKYMASLRAGWMSGISQVPGTEEALVTLLWLPSPSPSRPTCARVKVHD